jgi:tetratricopeptide (TPR) repeat protein
LPRACRESYWRHVLPPPGTVRASPQLPRPFGRTAAEVAKAEAWGSLLAYERTNPEHLGTVEFKLRVRLAYRLALAELHFYPEVWYGFGEFERSVSDSEACLTVLRSALRALTGSSLLGFGLADALEVEGDLEGAKAVHEQLLQQQHQQQPAAQTGTASCVGFCQYMRFARRAEGVAAARAVFKRAREAEQCDGTVFSCAAQIELRANKSPETCRNVFELGLKRFPEDAGLFHAYLDCVESLNDDGAAREVFERAVDALGASEEGLRAWERYRRFERDACRDGGDLRALANVERRMAETFKSKSDLIGLLGVTHRYSLFGAMPVSGSADVGFFERVAGQHKLQQHHQAPLGSQSAMFAQAASGGRSGSVPQPARSGSQVRGVPEAAAAPEDLSNVPPFLHKLVSLLPKKSAIAHMDVDFVIRNLTKGWVVWRRRARDANVHTHAGPCPRPPSCA